MKMVKSCANKITSLLIAKKTIEYEDYEIYSFGFETLIASIGNIIIILTIGTFLNRFIETLLFLVFYCSIRQFAGGFHAENYIRCLFCFITMFLTNIYVLDKLINSNSTTLAVVIAFVSYMGILFLVPKEHRHNPLSIIERKKYKKIVIYLCSILLLISVVCFNFTITYEYAMYLSSVIVCIFIMLILGLIKKGVTNL
jgi:accessory gene regulator B